MRMLRGLLPRVGIVQLCFLTSSFHMGDCVLVDNRVQVGAVIIAYVAKYQCVSVVCYGSNGEVSGEIVVGLHGVVSISFEAE